MLTEEPNWRQKPWLSRLIRVAVFIVPVLCAVFTSIIVSKVFPRPDTFPGVIFWWMGLLASVILVIFLVDRLAVRLLPLAALMHLTLAFPDRAPSRVRILRTAGTVRRLEEQVEAARDIGDMDQADAAEYILALASALNNHDRITRGHGERVRVFADLIAEEMQIPSHGQDRLRWVALLHDIGKIVVDSEILNNPGTPTEEEWIQLRRHPEEGAALIAPINAWLGEWSPGVEQHHEKFDGTGYPRGLAGDEISLGARVVAVADVYDVITSARSYKRPISAEAARQELAKSAGTHFDPRVVRAFLNVSLGKLRRAIGPAAWFAQLPVIGALEQFSRQIGIVGATAMIISALAAGGVIDVPAVGAIDEPGPAVVEAGSAGGSGDADASGTDSPGNDDPLLATGSTSTTPPTSVTTIVPSTSTTDPVADVTTTSTISTTTTTTLVVSTSTTTSTVPTTTTSSPTTTTTAPPQHAPVANPDSATTLEDTSVVVDVLANDTDADGDALTASAQGVESAAGGSLDCAAGSCTYVPPLDYNGNDSFTYRVTDSTGRFAVGSATVIVVAVNDGPIAVDDVAAVASGGSVFIQVLINDSDPEGDERLIVGFDASSTTGSVVQAGDAILLYSAPTGFTGADVFTYTISDPGGLTSTATVTVTVSAP